MARTAGGAFVILNQGAKDPESFPLKGFGDGFTFKLIQLAAQSLN
jgi:hypothetical protein